MVVENGAEGGSVGKRQIRSAREGIEVDPKKVKREGSHGKPCPHCELIVGPRTINCKYCNCFIGIKGSNVGNRMAQSSATSSPQQLPLGQSDPSLLPGLALTLGRDGISSLTSSPARLPRKASTSLLAIPYAPAELELLETRVKLAQMEQAIAKLQGAIKKQQPNSGDKGGVDAGISLKIRIPRAALMPVNASVPPPSKGGKVKPKSKPPSKPSQPPLSPSLRSIFGRPVEPEDLAALEGTFDLEGASEAGKYLSVLSSAPPHHIVSHIKSLRMDFMSCQIRPVLTKIMISTSNRGGIFNVPVDPVAQKIPEYPTIIKTPMDLGTIKGRLQALYYKDAEAFADDMRLVFNNAIKFNPSSHSVHECAAQLLAEFEAEWAKVTSRLVRDEQRRSEHHCQLCQGQTCQLCGDKCLKLDPAVLICHGPCSSRIKKSCIYFITPDACRLWCQKCYTGLPAVLPEWGDVEAPSPPVQPEAAESDTPAAGDAAAAAIQHQQQAPEVVPESSSSLLPPQPFLKKQLLKRRFDDEVSEAWVQCDSCSGWVHQVCALFNARANVEEPNFKCPICRLRQAATALGWDKQGQQDKQGQPGKPGRPAATVKAEARRRDTSSTCCVTSLAVGEAVTITAGGVGGGGTPCDIPAPSATVEDEPQPMVIDIEHTQQVQSTACDPMSIVEDAAPAPSSDTSSFIPQPMDVSPAEEAAGGGQIPQQPAPPAGIKKAHPPLDPSLHVYSASTLPETAMGRYIERRVHKLLIDLDASPEEHGAVTIRVISNTSSSHEVPAVVRHNFKASPSGEDAPAEIDFTSKALCMFQLVDGAEVCLFSMYVQEYGPDAPAFNARRVYISYLDSVEYFRPRRARTQVYHEMLAAYLDWVRRRGFTHAYFWSCPPQRGNNFIFWCHPAHQRTPTRDRLADWYKTMLKRCEKLGVAANVTNLHSSHFQEVARSLHQHRADAGAGTPADTRPELPPVFEGDFWVDEAQRLHRLVEEKSDGDFVSARAPQDLCRAALAHLIANPQSSAFMKPVDPVEQRCLDYLQVVTHPMDLGTVNTKLEAGEYASAAEFSRDVRLVFSNACTYNPAKHSIHIAAKQLQGTFDRAIKRLLKVAKDRAGRPVTLAEVKLGVEEVSLPGVNAEPLIRQQSEPYDCSAGFDVLRAGSPSCGTRLSRSKSIGSADLHFTRCTDRPQPTITPRNSVLTSSVLAASSLTSAGGSGMMSVPVALRPTAAVCPPREWRLQEYHDEDMECTEGEGDAASWKGKSAAGIAESRRASAASDATDTELLDASDEGETAAAMLTKGDSCATVVDESVPVAESDGGTPSEGGECEASSSASASGGTGLLCGQSQTVSGNKHKWLLSQLCKSVDLMKRDLLVVTLASPHQPSTAEDADWLTAVPVETELNPETCYDPDPPQSRALVDSRHTFMEMCQFRNYQFDSLRRAKYSSAMILYHLHRPEAHSLNPLCSKCAAPVRNVRYHCFQCTYDLCLDCSERSNCMCEDQHQLTPYRVTFEAR